MQQGSATKERDATRGMLRRLLPLAVLVGLAALAYYFDLHGLISFEQLALNREALRAFVADNYLLAILAFMAIYIAVIALSLPGGALLTISGGLLFGWLATGASVVFAATIGATILFAIAKTAIGEPLAARAGPWLGKLRKGFQDDALSYLLFLRLVPAFPFWLVNLAPALLGVPLSTFVVGTFFGIIPGTFAFAFVGAGLDSVIDAQIEANRDCLQSGAACTFRLDPGALLTTEILIAFAALGVIALIPVLVKRLRSRGADAG